MFKSPNLLVRLSEGDPARGCVIGFEPFSHALSLNRQAFGERFFRDRGITMVHVLCASNAWYQYPELPDALLAIRQAVQGFGRVITYGSSMGGYAAIRFAEQVGAHLAVAISPQYSVDLARVPFEVRWHAQIRQLDILHEKDAAPGSGHPPAVIVYDPRERLDRLHAELIAARWPTCHIALPFSGHPAGPLLAETDMLSTMILTCLDGTYDAGSIRKTAWARRRRSAQYAATLARHLPLKRMKFKLVLADRAVALAPRKSDYHSYAAMLLAACGQEDKAAAEHRLAMECDPAHPTWPIRWARFLMRTARTDEALGILKDHPHPAVQRFFLLRTISVAAALGNRWIEAAAAARKFANGNPRRYGLLLLDFWYLTRRKRLSPSAIRLDPFFAYEIRRTDSVSQTAKVRRRRA